MKTTGAVTAMVMAQVSHHVPLDGTLVQRPVQLCRVCGS